MNYSRAEYAQVSDALAQSLIIDPPLALCEAPKRWVRDSEGLKSLMAQYQTFDYSADNLPVRVLLSHFLAFNADKLDKPEFFCWPGAWMAGKRVSPEIKALFDRHAALFVDKADDDGIFPRVLPGRDEGLVHKTFESFYAFNLIYDVTRQWIATPGPFVYDYRWLSSSGSHADVKGFADRHFEMIYGVQPDRFEII
jgi:hypothetical protein